MARNGVLNTLALIRFPVPSPRSEEARLPCPPARHRPPALARSMGRSPIALPRLAGCVATLSRCERGCTRPPGDSPASAQSLRPADVLGKRRPCSRGPLASPLSMIASRPLRKGSDADAGEGRAINGLLGSAGGAGPGVGLPLCRCVKLLSAPAPMDSWSAIRGQTMCGRLGWKGHAAGDHRTYAYVPRFMSVFPILHRDVRLARTVGLWPSVSDPDCVCGLRWTRKASSDENP